MRELRHGKAQGFVERNLLGGVREVIVTADDVKGAVTIRMRDVPWDQALDVVLRAKGLGQVREGNLIRVAPQAVLDKEAEAEAAAASDGENPTDEAPPPYALAGIGDKTIRKLVDAGFGSVEAVAAASDRSGGM